jgi:hypothetical protein
LILNPPPLANLDEKHIRHSDISSQHNLPVEILLTDADGNELVLLKSQMIRSTTFIGSQSRDDEW